MVTQTDNTVDIFSDLRHGFKVKQTKDFSFLSSLVKKTDYNDFSEYYFGQTLYENQVGIIDAIIKSDVPETDIVEPRQTGKCLAKGTPVLMYDGTIKLVENIQEKDLIMGDDSTHRKVLSLSHGYEKMYKIVPRLRHQESYTVNESHILSIKDRDRNYKVRNLSVKEYLNSAEWNRLDNYRGYKVAVDFPEKELPIEPYWLGLWLGDGSKHITAITNMDKEIISYLEEYAKKLNLNLHKTKMINNRCSNYTISSVIIGVRNKRNNKTWSKNTLYNFLKDFNLKNNKHIPNLFFANSRKNRLELLAGLIDTDGYGDKRHGQENVGGIALSNYILVCDVLKLIRSLGFRASMKKKTIKYKYKDKVSNKYTYVISFYGDLSIIPTKIKRKQWKKSILREYPLLYGFDIKELDIGEYYGFTIDGNGLFVLGDFTVTHNTSSIAVANAIACETEGMDWNEHNAEPYRIGIFGPKLGQAQIDLQRLKFWANHNKQGKALINWAKTTNVKIAWHNGSEIHAVSASEQTETEGLTFNRIIVEEAQKISDHAVSQVIIPMLGACVCEGTLLVDENGYRVPVEKYVSSKIIGYKDNYYIDDVVWFDKTGQKECYRIITNSGRILECSYDHPILIKLRNNRVLRYIETNNLLMGMQVAVLDEIPLFGSEKMVDARLVGMLIGDGSYSSKKCRINFCGCDEELFGYIKNKGYDFNCRESNITKSGKIFQDGMLSNVYPWFKKLGIYGQSGVKKRLPLNMDKYSKETICELLAGLFDTDGYIGIQYNRMGVVELNSISRELLWEVVCLLDKLGIHSKICERPEQYKMWTSRHNGRKYVCKSKKGYRLAINEKISLERFHRNIKLLIKHKQEKLDKLINILSSHKPKRQKNIKGLYFERIIKIEKIGIKTVYNLTAKNEHNYIANGIITHNTGGKLVKIGTVRAIRNHFWRSCCKNPRTRKVAHHWMGCDLLLRQGGYKEYNGYKIPNFILDRMPWMLKEKYLISGYFPNTPDYMYYGDMEYDDFLTQYELEWLEQYGLFLSRDELDRMFMGNYPLEFSQINANDELYAGIDFATGIGQDDTSVSVFRKIGNLKRKIFGTSWGELPIPDQKRELVNLFGPHGRFHCRAILGDVGGNGEAVISDLRAEYNMPIYGVHFQSTDRTIKTCSMNMKTSMFNDFKRDLQNSMIQHYGIDAYTPNDIQLQYRKDKREWETLEQEARLDTVNKKIQATESEKDDICCLSSDTKIPLLDGDISTIEELSKMNVENKYTYSLDENKNIVPGKILKVWETGKKETLKITLDNGYSFRCTSDHLIMLRDGNYLEAQKLLIGQSIMPLYKHLRKLWKNAKRKYEVVYNPLVNDWVPTHKQIFGKDTPKNHIIHHKDFNPLNNNPNNLDLVHAKEHRKIHSNAFWKTMTKEQRRKRLQKAIDANIIAQKGISHERRVECARKGLDNMYKKYGKNFRSKITKERIMNMTDEERKNFTKPMRQGFLNMTSEQHKQRVMKGVRNRDNKALGKKISITRKKLFAENKIICHNKGIISDKLKKFMEKYSKEKLLLLFGIHQKWNDVSKRLNVTDNFLYYIRKKYDMVPYRKFNYNFNELIRLNHKIISIEKCGIEPVYDMTIEKYHNFAIWLNDSGIFVHNCSDVLGIRAMKLSPSIIGSQQIQLHRIPYAISYGSGR